MCEMHAVLKIAVSHTPGAYGINKAYDQPRTRLSSGKRESIINRLAIRTHGRVMSHVAAAHSYVLRRISVYSNHCEENNKCVSVDELSRPGMRVACSGLWCCAGGKAVWGLCCGALLPALCGERAAASASNARERLGRKPPTWLVRGVRAGDVGRIRWG